MVAGMTSGVRPPRVGFAMGLLGVLLLGSSCDYFGPRDCTTIEVFGLDVRAYDSQTGDPISEGLTGSAAAGSHYESLNYAGSNILIGASERPGLYHVTVSAPGYETWIMENVRVTKDDCHVRTVTVSPPPASLGPV